LLTILAGLLISSLGRAFGCTSYDTRIKAQERFEIFAKGENEILS
jgi:hypothetical protein